MTEKEALKKAELVWDKMMAFSSYGFNRCITADTVIKTICGDITLGELIALKDKPKLISYDSSTDSFFEQDLKCIHDNGIQEVFEIELENGVMLKATEHHRFLTESGYKSVCDLTVSDRLISWRN